MAGRPQKEGSESKSFALYKRTWIILKKLEYMNLLSKNESKPLKEIAHEAIEDYFNKEKKLGKNKGL